MASDSRSGPSSILRMPEAAGDKKSEKEKKKEEKGTAKLLDKEDIRSRVVRLMLSWALSGRAPRWWLANTAPFFF